MKDLGVAPTAPEGIVGRADCLAGVTTAAVVQGTSAATVTGLSFTLEPGTYAINAFMSVTSVGTLTQTLSAAFTGTATGKFSFIRTRSGTASVLTFDYNPNQSNSMGSQVAGTTAYTIYGYITVTATGVFSIAAFRTAGTSMTTAAGAILTAVRV